MLRGEECPHCGRALLLDDNGDHAATMIAAVREQWTRWRLVIYFGVVFTGLGFGSVPLGGVLLAVVAMFLGHVMLLRRPLRWLSPARRVTTRLAIKLWFALLGVLSFVANLIAAPLLAFAGFGAVFSALTGLGVFGLYLEGGLWLLDRRIAREAKSGRLDPAEWFVPTALFGGLLVSAVAGVVVLWGTLNTLESLDVPGVAQLARWLLEVR